MTRYTGPKDRLSRREGFDLFGKGAKLTRLTVPPGVHGPKGTRRRGSQYLRQLREKQKVKRLYGIAEKQFKNYVNKASRSKGNIGVELLVLLERRLDNIIYRLGLAVNRPSARQLVSHGHVIVDGRKINIPSYQVKVGETITLLSKAMEIPFVKKLIEEDSHPPAWLAKRAVVGKMIRLPSHDDVLEPIGLQDVIEFYSR